MLPTATHTTRRCGSSDRNPRASSASAALVVPYTPSQGQGAPIEWVVTTTTGSSAARRCSSALRTTSAAPTRLVANISCHNDAGASATRTSGELPDMYSRTSIPPIHAAASATRRAQSASEVTSQLHARASPPAPRISSAASSTRSRRRAPNATRAPAAPAPNPSARPMPDDAPTTSTRRPSRLAGMVTGFLLSIRVCGVKTLVEMVTDAGRVARKSSRRRHQDELNFPASARRA